MPCPDDCKGCLCHIKAPCNHCKEFHLDDSPEAEAYRAEKERMKLFFFGERKTYHSILSDAPVTLKCPSCGDNSKFFAHMGCFNCGFDPKK